MLDFHLGLFSKNVIEKLFEFLFYRMFVYVCKIYETFRHTFNKILNMLYRGITLGTIF